MRSGMLCASVVLTLLPLAARAQAGGRGGGGSRAGGGWSGGGLPRLNGPSSRGAAGARYGEWPGRVAPRWPPSRPIGNGTPFVRGRPSHVVRVRPSVVVVWPPSGFYGYSSYPTWPRYYGGGSYTAGEMLAEETEQRVGRSKVIDVGSASSAAPGSPAAALTAERVADTMLRLRWAGNDPTVVEASLVVADSTRRVLAAQRVTAPPYTAVFDGARRIAFVGVTLVHDDDVSTTTLVPLSAALGGRR